MEHRARTAAPGSSGPEDVLVSGQPAGLKASAAHLEPTTNSASACTSGADDASYCTAFDRFY
ncbi:hypothetical protein SAMD00023353_2300960 [Rosellinia necatrix]|uniref:Uncharacterized protein n=1 Tax=Rosellinia necatrix TaxID=77044 RepID=A0A1S8A7U7_ROSNE|nr:hypothetical protein SAMD00023353_2300960 [Rosellinia necatrix]